MQRVERWNCDQQVVSSNPTRSKSRITTLGKLFTPMCLCLQAVFITCYWPRGGDFLLLVHRDQLRAQRSVTSMGSLYHFYSILDY